MALKCRNGKVYDCRQGLNLVFYRKSGLLAFSTRAGVADTGGNGLTLDGDDKFYFGYSNPGSSELHHGLFQQTALFLKRLLDLGPQEGVEELGDCVIFSFAPKPSV